MLDRLQVERERGITVKAQTATLVYNYQGVAYLLNLIDTLEHLVDLMPKTLWGRNRHLQDDTFVLYIF